MESKRQIEVLFGREEMVIDLKNWCVLIFLYFLHMNLTSEKDCCFNQVTVSEAQVCLGWLGWGWIRRKKKDKERNFLFASDRICNSA